MKVDPITFAVVRNRLISIANGMIETAAHCGVSSFLSTIMDCSFALLDADASIVALSGNTFRNERKASSSRSKVITNECATVPNIGIPKRRPASTFEVPAQPPR